MQLHPIYPYGEEINLTTENTEKLIVMKKEKNTENTEKKRIVSHRLTQIYTGLPNRTPFLICFLKKLKPGMEDPISGF